MRAWLRDGLSEFHLLSYRATRSRVRGRAEGYLQSKADAAGNSGAQVKPEVADLRLCADEEERVCGGPVDTSLEEDTAKVCALGETVPVPGDLTADGDPWREGASLPDAHRSTEGNEENLPFDRVLVLGDWERVDTAEAGADEAVDLENLVEPDREVETNEAVLEWVCILEAARDGDAEARGWGRPSNRRPRDALLRGGCTVGVRRVGGEVVEAGFGLLCVGVFLGWLRGNLCGLLGLLLLLALLPLLFLVLVLCYCRCLCHWNRIHSQSRWTPKTQTRTMTQRTSSLLPTVPELACPRPYWH